MFQIHSRLFPWKRKRFLEFTNFSCELITFIISQNLNKQTALVPSGDIKTKDTCQLVIIPKTLLQTSLESIKVAPGSGSAADGTPAVPDLSHIGMTRRPAALKVKHRHPGIGSYGAR